MITFQKLLLAETQKHNSEYQQVIAKEFEHSNTGQLKKSGVKKLVKQIQTGRFKYCGFPEWVLKSWIDASRLGAIPLKYNRYLDTQHVIPKEGGLESQDLTYSGFVVDSDRKEEYGIETISLATSHKIDLEKYAKLLKFKFAANEAKKIIVTLDQKKQEIDEQDSQTPEPPGNVNPTSTSTPTAEEPISSPKKPSSNGRGSPPGVVV